MLQLNLKAGQAERKCLVVDPQPKHFQTEVGLRIVVLFIEQTETSGVLLELVEELTDSKLETKCKLLSMVSFHCPVGE